MTQLNQSNRLKQAMHEGRKAYGLVLTWPSPDVIEIVGAHLGFDYVQIDGEHGAFNLAEIEEACRAAQMVGMTPIARVPNILPGTINQFLDRGVRGIVAPHISTKAQAEQVVRACYFGPLGERSFGAGRGVDYGLVKKDRPAYYAEMNRRMIVGVMLEDRASIENIEEIMSVQGIDFFYFGMNDFSQGMGFPGRPDAPEVLQARDATIRKIRAAGRKMKEDIAVEMNLMDVIVAGVRKITDQREADRAGTSGGE